MAHALAASMSSTGDFVLTLSPGGTGPRYSAGALKLTAVKTGGAAATFRVQPVYAAPDQADPTATTLQLTLASSGPVLFLDSTANPEVRIGQEFSRGYTPDVYGKPLATHLLVTVAAAGVLQVVVD